MRPSRARRPRPADGRLLAHGRLLALATGVLLLVAFPAAVAADSHLERSTPADGTTVPSPFDGPIVLEFSEPLAEGSRAVLVGPDGATVATARVDGPDARMTFTPDAALGMGTYTVRWTSIAEDTHLARGTVEFTVAPAVASPSPAPTAEPTPAPTASATAAPDTTAPASPWPTDGDASGSGADVVLPIVVALLVVGAGAAYLLTRRNRPPAPG